MNGNINNGICAMMLTSCKNSQFPSNAKQNQFPAPVIEKQKQNSNAPKQSLKVPPTGQILPQKLIPLE